MKYFFGGIAVIVVILGLGWIAQGNDFFMYKVFAPKYANVQRETFTHTNSYTQGTIQNLRSEQSRYVTEKDPAAKEALRQVILHEVADFDIDILPLDLRRFVEGLRSE